MPRKTLGFYSAAAVPLAAMALPIGVYLPPFYAESVGMSLGSIGLIFTLARIWDVVTDPIMGAIIDRYDTRWGRRKHWIAISVPIMMIAVWMIFLPDSEGTSAGYLAFWLLFLYVGYTMMAIAHQSWGAELATTYDERSRLFAWREIFVVVGMTLALAIPAGIQLFGSGELAQQVGAMGIYCLVLLPIMIWPCLQFVPDKRDTTNVAVDWLEAIKIIVANRVLWRLLFADLTANFAPTASGTLYIFFAAYVFELREHASFALLLYFLSSAIAMPAWLKLAYRLGKDQAFKVALGYGIFIKVALFLLAEPGNVALFWGYTFFYGVAFGAAPTLLRSMMADLTDMDELQAGKKRAGIFFAMLTTVDKLASAIAVGVVLMLLEHVVGFQPGTDNSPEAIHGLLVLYCAAPIVVLGLSFIPLHRYPLDKAKHDEVRLALEELANRAVAPAAGSGIAPTTAVGRT